MQVILVGDRNLVSSAITSAYPGLKPGASMCSVRILNTRLNTHSYSVPFSMIFMIFLKFLVFAFERQLVLWETDSLPRD